MKKLIYQSVYQVNRDFEVGVLAVVFGSPWDPPRNPGSAGLDRKM
jgi:hypothetical protein